jgi:hypothetical protein
MKLILNCSKPRLSDEEIDPLEQDDTSIQLDQHEGWVPWDLDDLLDIRNIIDNRMPMKQRQILEGFLKGLNHFDMGVTEKYWRYHYDKAIEFIQKELRL